MIIIKEWFGRLGNNIIQLDNIIHIALYYKHNIVFKVHHKFFDVKIIEKFFSKYQNDEIIQDSDNFFNRHKLHYPKEIYTENSEIKTNILKDSFLIKDINKLNTNDVVIHIRSGDIFSNTPHPGYVPPPLAYYVKQLDKYNYNNIIIVCEDTVNPVVNKLLQLYKNSTYNKNNLTQDIKLILGATNIISSVGSFVNSLLKISDNIKNHYGKATANNEELKEYYLVTKPWRNNKIQRDYMLSYQFKDN